MILKEVHRRGAKIAMDQQSSLEADLKDVHRCLQPGVVLEGFLGFPETTQDLTLNDGYTPFQLQGFMRHTQRAE